MDALDLLSGLFQPVYDTTGFHKRLWLAIDIDTPPPQLPKFKRPRAQRAKTLDRQRRTRLVSRRWKLVQRAQAINKLNLNIRTSHVLSIKV